MSNRWDPAKNANGSCASVQLKEDIVNRFQCFSKSWCTILIGTIPIASPADWPGGEATIPIAQSLMTSVKVEDDDELASNITEYSPQLENPYFPGRANSVSSSDRGFISDYGTFESSAPREHSLPTPPQLTYWSGVCLVVGNQIGAGIFGSPAAVNGSVGSLGMSLAVWTIAGCLAWTGAGSLSLHRSKFDSSIIRRTRICDAAQWRGKDVS